MATLTAPAGSRRRSTAIDMTPMVDLAFLLLTFFVLTTNLTKPIALQMVMPEKAAEPLTQPPIDAKRVVTLVLGDQNKIHWYSGTDIDHAQTTNFSGNGIRKILIDKKSTIKNLYVIIKPSDKSQYKNMVDILDEILITEIEHYAIVNPEPADKELVSL